ncbi:single-stranded-DNA-specific exonuclease RecJ [Paenibacillus sp. NFR01]|uniref:single-stranded-DNA-specific exonuclease RecJ n=1 Tax=Paenibacillus sp. NFR01 TaxID=1566279 RepID=UPI0008B4ECCF|nr:single-stranded-DNA-specific exonuclease RecJ [Paenibacillus sp. NFR01]SET69120.1 single-stranded-DNA-specific exonuclease [Paenibacillus sp. NFR01]
MLQSKTKWHSPATDPQTAAELARSLSVSPLLSSLLVNRGFTRPEAALLFMDGGEGESYDPYLLKGMAAAVPRIRKALEEEEHILVYGDYDADGVSSTTLMIYLLRHLGASFDTYIPHRSNEGYGLHNHALDFAKQQGVTLVITVDTGISAVSQIAYATELGIDVIVTDHHEPPEQLPEAYALINPKQHDCPYPFKGLAGVGVAYKLAEALLGGDVPPEWAEIAAIGTVADLMPLLGENRSLVRKGLVSMRQSPFPGVRALLGVSGVTAGAVNATNIAFGMAPRINASGRLDHAGRAVALLTTSDPVEAEKLADELDLLNKERQQIVERIVEEATAMLERQTAGGTLPDIIVLADQGWNVGVVGIVAARLLEKYYRPVIILDIHPDTGMCKGSARSIPGLDIYEALTSCAELMDHYGGHPAAAGMSLHKDQLEAFAAALNRYAAGVLKPEDFVAWTAADFEAELSQLTLNAAAEIERLAPFGMANPLPRFIVRGAEVKETRKLGQEGKHLKLVLQQGKSSLEAIAFGKGSLAELLPPGTKLDALCELTINEWNGSRKPQLMLQDVAVPQVQLFDLRGTKDAVGKAAELREALLPYQGQAPFQAAAVLAASRMTPLAPLKDMTLWVYEDSGGISKLHEGATVREDGRLSLLCLIDLPDTPEQLEAVLAGLPQADNIALLHPARSGVKERLFKPTRELFISLYKMLAAIAASPVKEQEALLRLCRQSELSPRMIRKMLDVFEELEFIERSQGQVVFVKQPQAKNLTASLNYIRLSQIAEMEQYLLDGSSSDIHEWMFTRRTGVS